MTADLTATSKCRYSVKLDSGEVFKVRSKHIVPEGVAALAALKELATALKEGSIDQKEHDETKEQLMAKLEKTAIFEEARQGAASAD